MVITCFPATATVFLENGQSLSMYELQIGDHVQTSILINFSENFFNLMTQIQYNF